MGEHGIAYAPLYRNRIVIMIIVIVFAVSIIIIVMIVTILLIVIIVVIVIIIKKIMISGLCDGHHGHHDGQGTRPTKKQLVALGHRETWFYFSPGTFFQTMYAF